MRHFGKYLARSRTKFEKDLREVCPDLDDEHINKIVRKLLKKELASGVQTIQYQINTLMTTNGF